MKLLVLESCESCNHRNRKCSKHIRVGLVCVCVIILLIYEEESKILSKLTITFPHIDYTAYPILGYKPTVFYFVISVCLQDHFIADVPISICIKEANGFTQRSVCKRINMYIKWSEKYPQWGVKKKSKTQRTLRKILVLALVTLQLDDYDV